MPLFSVRHDHYFHFEDGSSDLKPLLEAIMATQAELAAQLSGVRDKLSEAATEIVAKITELTDALAAAGSVSPEVQQLADDLTAQATGLADIVPAPTE